MQLAGDSLYCTVELDVIANILAVALPLNNYSTSNNLIDQKGHKIVTVPLNIVNSREVTKFDSLMEQ